MPLIEVTRQARDELRELIETRQLPVDTRERVSRSLLTLEEFPRAGKQLSGVWRDCRVSVRGEEVEAAFICSRRSCSSRGEPGLVYSTDMMARSSSPVLAPRSRRGGFRPRPFVRAVPLIPEPHR